MKNPLKAFQRILWPYKIEKMDIERDKKVIITRVLNYGTWNDLKLLQKIYTKDDIKEVLSNPQRGEWLEKVLNFWSKVLDIRIDEDTYKKAILRMDPEERLLTKNQNFGTN